MKLRNQQEQVDSLKGYSKREISELKDNMHRSYEEQLKRITEMVSSMLLYFTYFFHLHLCLLTLGIILSSMCKNKNLGKECTAALLIHDPGRPPFVNARFFLYFLRTHILPSAKMSYQA